jgi:hypothetical protein
VRDWLGVRTAIFPCRKALFADARPLNQAVSSVDPGLEGVPIVQLLNRPDRSCPSRSRRSRPASPLCCCQRPLARPECSASRGQTVAARLPVDYRFASSCQVALERLSCPPPDYDYVPTCVDSSAASVLQVTRAYDRPLAP